jgi:hypothetical protein
MGVQFTTVVGQNANAVDAEFRGVTFADFANCHNYFVHPNWAPHSNNQTWMASDATPNAKADHLYGNFGNTWYRHFLGHTNAELLTLPKVTTETGTTITQPGDADYSNPARRITEEDQALMYLSCYLAQYKQGWKYTSMYILRDRIDEGGNQTFGFYESHWVDEQIRYPSNPRTSAHYMHNFTSILADNQSIQSPGTLAYSITPLPATVHDLLLQKNDGKMMLVIWGEKYVYGSTADNVTVQFDKTYETIKIYNPAQYDPSQPEKGTLPIRTESNVNSVVLPMLNHPFILEFSTSEPPIEELPITLSANTGDGAVWYRIKNGKGSFYPHGHEVGQGLWCSNDGVQRPATETDDRFLFCFVGNNNADGFDIYCKAYVADGAKVDKREAGAEQQGKPILTNSATAVGAKWHLDLRPANGGNAEGFGIYWGDTPGDGDDNSSHSWNFYASGDVGYWGNVTNDLGSVWNFEPMSAPPVVTYTITVENGTANPTTAAANATVTVTANAAPTGKEFDKWESGDVTFANANNATTTFTMPAKNVSVKATYKDILYTITVENGTANPTTAAANATVTVTANAAPTGKEFDKWESSDVTFANANNTITTFTMPAKNVAAKATYKDFTSLQEIGKSVAVIAQKGKVILYAGQEAATYSVYNLIGQFVAQGVVTGTKEIALSKGVYIVKINNKTTKIIVN